MDQRGTGGSSVIDCPALQNGVGVYEQAAAACARQLGMRAGAFGSAAVADDLAAILHGLGIGKVDVYGDSYGSYAAQVFALHHPGLVRAAVLDGTYDNSFNPFEPEESVSLRHAWRALCARSGACHGILRSIGAFGRRCARTRSSARGRDADGFVEHVHLTPPLFAQLVEDATFSYTFFRDLPGALRAYRHGDRAPMLRLAAEDVSFDAAGGGAAGYSVGDFAAVSCHDYPTIWDVAASPRRAAGQLDRAIARLPAGVFAPFTKRVWLELAGREPARASAASAGRRRASPTRRSRRGPRPHIPVLVARRRVRPGDARRATPAGRRRPGPTRPTSRCATRTTSAPWPTSRAARAASCAGS